MIQPRPISRKEKQAVRLKQAWKAYEADPHSESCQLELAQCQWTEAFADWQRGPKTSISPKLRDFRLKFLLLDFPISPSTVQSEGLFRRVASESFTGFQKSDNASDTETVKNNSTHH